LAENDTFLGTVATNCFCGLPGNSRVQRWLGDKCPRVRHCDRSQWRWYTLGWQLLFGCADAAGSHSRKSWKTPSDVRKEQVKSENWYKHNGW